MNLSHEIPFTRFHLPDGYKSQSIVQVDSDTFAQYEKVRAAGLRMTVEILSTGAVSQCIEHPDRGDFDCVVCDNSPGEPRAALKKMLMRFDPTKVAAWREEMS